MFRTGCKKFYNLLRYTNTNVKKAPSKEDIENFWGAIYREKVRHNEANSIKNQRQQNSCMEWGPISETEVTRTLRTTINWKAPGRDHISNFCLKQLMATHKHLATLFNKLTDEDQTPEWLMAGVTLLIPKNENTEKSKNYRPTICLPTIYKLITSTISKRMQKYTDDQNLMPKEQKGCRRRSKGWNDELLISKAILQECKHRKKYLCMARIDHQKAFDRVPHSWIIKPLELIGINNKITSFTKKIMSHWRTRMCLHTENKLTETEEIEIQCGIFQGDSLSLLLFSISLIHLTEQLNRLNMGYEEHTTKTKIFHLLYMDNLKLLGKSEEELQKHIQTVTTFSDDIHTEFGLDKCAEIVFKKGKLVHLQNLVVDINTEIQELEQGKTYKYLGVEESDGTQHQQMKERLKKECTRRLRMILKSELNAKNKITAIGALAVPVLRQSFGIINWRAEEIKKIYRKTRKILTLYKMHHPKTDIDRLYVERKEGGRGLSQIEAAYKPEIINIAEYLNKKYKEDQFVNIIRSHDSSQPNMNSTVTAPAKIIDNLS
jgi:hypothetical protein